MCIIIRTAPRPYFYCDVIIVPAAAGGRGRTDDARRVSNIRSKQRHGVRAKVCRGLYPASRGDVRRPRGTIREMRRETAARET